MRISKYVILTCMIMASNEVLSQSLNDPNPFGIKLEMPSMFSTHGDEHKQGIDYSKIKIPEPRSQDSQPVIGDISYSKELEKSAKKGVSSAQVELGKCYLFGRGIQVDDKKAQKWFEEAIKQGNPDAMFWLGYMYETQRAKKIKLASGWNKHFMPEYFRERTDEKERDAYRNAAKEYFEKAASLGQPDALYKLYQQSSDLASLKTAAEKGHVKAQYDYAAYILNQFKSDNRETTLGLAKQWFAKAAENDHPDAAKMVAGIEDAEGQIVIAKRDAEERARKEALEAARRDSIAAVELARQMAEAEQRRKQDSIDIAEGRKLPRKEQLISDCRVFSRRTDASYGYEFENSEFFKQLVALCNNDVLAYYGKNRLDELDKALYKKSEAYRTDLNNFNKRKNEKMAIVFPLDKDSEPEWEFSANSFSFRANGTRPSPTDNANLLGLMDLVFPVNPNLVKPDDHMKCWHTFKCSNLEKLQEIRANKDNLEMVYVIKPGVAAISRYWNSDVKDYVYLVNPINLFLLNRNSGEVVLDLSNCLRKAAMATEKQKIEAYAKAHYNKIKPKKHSTPKQVRCVVCGGKGYTEYFPIGSTILKRERCTYCYGNGYTMEYYY